MVSYKCERQFFSAMALAFLILMSIPVVFFLTSPTAAADFSARGHVYPDDWRATLGYHSPSLKVDWYQTEKDGSTGDGYNIVAAHSLRFLKCQYKQDHRSDRDFDTQELSGMATVYGVGLGVARSWVGKWDEPRWTAKAQFTLDRKYFSVGVGWASNFSDRRSWSIAPRAKIRALGPLNFILSAKWEEVKARGILTRWRGFDWGVSVEIPKL